jgi:hypothetical protein
LFNETVAPSTFVFGDVTIQFSAADASPLYLMLTGGVVSSVAHSQIVAVPFLNADLEMPNEVYC